MQGVHFVDVFRYLLGEVESVYADLFRLNESIAGEDAGVVLFSINTRQQGGEPVRAVLDCNRLADHDADNTRLTMGEMMLEGAEGTIRLDGRGRIWVRKHSKHAAPGGPNPPEVEHCYEWSPTDFGGDCVYRLQAHVVSHLLQDAPLHNTARDFLRNVEVEEAIYTSAAQHNRVNVGLPMGEL